MKLLLCVALLVSLMPAAGCTWPASPVMAPLIINEKGPVAAFSPDVKATRVGRAASEGIILVGWGDSSIAAAVAKGGITRIHHVDSESQNLLGIYSKYETVVYGE